MTPGSEIVTTPSSLPQPPRGGRNRGPSRKGPLFSGRGPGIRDAAQRAGRRDGQAWTTAQEGRRETGTEQERKAKWTESASWSCSFLLGGRGNTGTQGPLWGRVPRVISKDTGKANSTQPDDALRSPSPGRRWGNLPPQPRPTDGNGGEELRLPSGRRAQTRGGV